MVDESLNRISSAIIKASINVHNELGPGLLESVYRKCLAKVLQEMGYHVVEELYLPLTFRGKLIEEKAFRIDLLVDNEVIVELKSVEEMKKVYYKQTLTYLRLMDKRLGLLINFNVPLLKDGINRIAN